MAQMTFGQHLRSAQDFVVDDTTTTQTSLSSTRTFLKREINNTVKDIFNLFKKYNLRPLPKTASTVANQIYYHNPPGLTKIESVTVAIGSIVQPLEIVHSQEEWNRLQMVTITSGYPTKVFPRRDDFGIYPTPSSVSTLTIVGNYAPLNMTADDYTTETVTFANNSTTVTGSGTAFTSSMVGRHIVQTDSEGVPSGNFYRISAVVSATELTLESYFEEVGSSGATYVIGEVPNIPEELHEFVPYRAAAIYHATRRKDPVQAQTMMNYYYTGDFTNPNRRGDIKGGVLNYLLDLKMKGSGNSQLTDIYPKMEPIEIGGIWSTVIS